MAVDDAPEVSPELSSGLSPETPAGAPAEAAPPATPVPAGGLAQIIRFCLVGGVNTLIDLVGYMALTGLGVNLFVANFASTTAGMSFSFVANKYFTFGGGAPGGAAKQGALFFAFTAFGLWVIQPLVIVAATAAANGLGWPLTGLLAWAPKLAAIGVGLVWNYAAYSRVVFRR
ncbi:putative flippase GtrA [Saccharothrix coeruleofusca]|uniref:GtrA family protein n=1 Tax=Saccharothrix coeruleofusca TaxID=33919 RepID=UPI0027DD30C8|nr:GtrA family protein [Saccharothrix coeruleofusca]MBP2340120.1 putative flippase GtrA [Saccharothrix coeruleofusca]